MNIFYEEKELVFFFLIENRTKFIYHYGPTKGYEYLLYSFIYYYNPKYFYLNRFKYDFYGYIIYEIYDENKTYYSYYENIEHFNSTKIDISDQGISVTFRDDFTTCPNINYLLIITDIKNKNLFNSKLSIFENFYLKKQYDNPEFEFYFFSSNNISHINYVYANIFINNSQKFNFKDKNKEFIIDVLAEAEPPKMVYIYNATTYIHQNNNSNNSNKFLLVSIIIIIIILLIIIIGVIIKIIRKRKPNKYNENSLKEEINMPMGDL